MFIKNKIFYRAPYDTVIDVYSKSVQTTHRLLKFISYFGDFGVSVVYDDIILRSRNILR